MIFSILFILPFCAIYGHLLPANQQYKNSCSNVFNRTCDNLNVQGQSLSSSVWGGSLNWENLPGSLGYELEDQYYKDQLELLTDQKHNQEPYMKDLQDLYKSCFTYKKSDFYESPLIRKVFSACGGDGIFEPAIEIKEDIEQILADLHTNFGVSSAFIISFGNNFRIDSMLCDYFDKASMNQIYKKLHNNREPDQEFSKIANKILQLQREINSREHFQYRQTSYTKYGLKTRLENYTVDWVKYIELSVTKNDFDVTMDLYDLKIIDHVVRKYGKKIFLGYVFFGVLDYLEVSLGLKVYGNETKHEAGFTEKQCFEMTTSVRLPFFAQYFKSHSDQVKEEAIERSGQELLKDMIQTVDESKQITEEAKKNIIEKLESLQIITQYPSTLKDEKVVETYVKEVDLGKFENFFEKMASILGTNFRLTTKFYFESKANFVWWTASSTRWTFMALDSTERLLLNYAKNSNDVPSCDDSVKDSEVSLWIINEALVSCVPVSSPYCSRESNQFGAPKNYIQVVQDIKNTMQNDVFFDTSKIQSFQLLDWYMAAAIAEAVAVYNSESKITKDVNNRKNFFSCMELMNERDTYQEEVSSIYIQLALKVFLKRSQMSGQTLQEFFDTFIMTRCGTANYPASIISNQIRIRVYSPLQRYLAMLPSFSTTYKCKRNEEKTCSLL